MTGLERRTIDELFARYELEPELRDVFVEGQFDKDVLANYFRSTKQLDRMVYEIDSVEVPNEILRKQNLTEGNKQRVIALARALSSLPEKCSYRCLIDKDLDHWFGGLEKTARLVWTNYCSIELNFFIEEILRDILIITAKSRINSLVDYNNSLIATLRELYVFRLADRELGWNLSWLPIERFITQKESMIIFDDVLYIERLLIKNTKSGLRGDFEKSVEQWKDCLSGDHRNYVRGHDFINLLALTVQKFRGIKEFSSSECIQRLFVLLASNRNDLLNDIV